MKTRFLRWWYRITGQKANAEDMLQLAKMLDRYTNSLENEPSHYMMDRWEREYAHIYNLYTTDRTKRTSRR